MAAEEQRTAPQDPAAELQRLRERVAQLESRLVEVHDLEAALEATGEAERRLRLALEMQGENLRRYRELFDFAPLPLLTLNKAGLIETVNLSTAALFGEPRTGLEGRPMIQFVDPHARRAMLDHIRNCRRSEYSVRTELELLTYRGQNRIPVEIHSHSRRGDDGLFLSTLIDLRDRNRAEEERRRVAAAEAASRAKDQFLASLSHELRTPLSPIANLLAVLRLRPDLPEDIHPLLDMIERNLWLEVRLVDDLLDTTRLVRHKLELACEPLDLHPLLQEVAQMLADEFKQAEVALELTLEAGVYRINADPTRIRQVFWNLLKNAAKFTPTGGRVRVRSLNPVPDQLKVLVEDTGVGMDPAQIERLFEPFEQVREAHGGGLGLGLAIAKGIVDAHGGTLSARSVGRNRGSIFSVVLPTLP